MTPEAKVRNPVVRWAKANGILHLRLTMRAGTSSGWPDDVFIYRGVVAFVEFKRPHGTPTKLQQRRMREIDARDVPVCWFDNADQACAFLRAQFKMPMR